MINVQQPNGQAPRPSPGWPRFGAQPPSGSPARHNAIVAVRFAAESTDDKSLRGARPAIEQPLPCPGPSEVTGHQHRRLPKQLLHDRQSYRALAHATAAQFRQSRYRAEFEAGYRHVPAIEVLPCFLTGETLAELHKRLMERLLSPHECGQLARRIDDLEMEEERPLTNARIREIRCDPASWLGFCHGYMHYRGIVVPHLSPAATEFDARQLLRTASLTPRDAGALFARIEDMALVSRAERHFDTLSAWQHLYAIGQAHSSDIPIPRLAPESSYETCLVRTIEGGLSATQFGALQKLTLERWQVIERLASHMRFSSYDAFSHTEYSQYATGWHSVSEQQAREAQTSLEALFQDSLLKRNRSLFEVGAVAKHIDVCKTAVGHLSRQADRTISHAACRAREIVKYAAHRTSTQLTPISPYMTDAELAALFFDDTLSSEAKGQVARRLQFQHRSNLLLHHLEGMYEGPRLERFEAGYRQMGTWLKPLELEGMSLDACWKKVECLQLPEQHGAMLAALDRHRVSPGRSSPAETNLLMSPPHSMSLERALDYLHGYLFATWEDPQVTGSMRSALRPPGSSERERGSMAFRFDLASWSAVECQVAMTRTAYATAMQMSSPPDLAWLLSSCELRGPTLDAIDYAQFALNILTGLALNSGLRTLENWFGRLDLLRKQIVHARERATDGMPSQTPGSALSELPACSSTRAEIHRSAELLTVLARLTALPVITVARLFNGLSYREKVLTVADLPDFIANPDHRATWLLTTDRGVMTLHISDAIPEATQYAWYDPIHGLLGFRDIRRFTRFVASLFTTNFHGSRGTLRPNTPVRLRSIPHEGIGSMLISATDLRTLGEFIEQTPPEPAFPQPTPLDLRTPAVKRPHESSPPP